MFPAAPQAGGGRRHKNVSKILKKVQTEPKKIMNSGS